MPEMRKLILGDTEFEVVDGTARNDIDVLDARMDTFTHLDDGSTSGDAELADIRVGADGTTYATAGDAVRGQVDNVRDALDNVQDDFSNIFVKNYIDVTACYDKKYINTVDANTGEPVLTDVTQSITSTNVFKVKKGIMYTCFAKYTSAGYVWLYSTSTGLQVAGYRMNQVGTRVTFNSKDYWQYTFTPDADYWCSVRMGLSDYQYSLFVNGNSVPTDYPDYGGIIFKNTLLNDTLDYYASEVWGKNLLHHTAESFTQSGVTFTVNSDKSITVNGTATASIDYYLLGSVAMGAAKADDAGLKSGEKYIVSVGYALNNKAYIRLVSAGGTTESIMGDNYSFTMGSNLTLIFRIVSGAVFNNVTIYPMIRYKKILDAAYSAPMLKGEILKDEMDKRSIPLLGYKTSDLLLQSIGSALSGRDISNTIDTSVIATLQHDGYVAHDGTVLKYGNTLYCIYTEYNGTGGDAAVNPNAKVRLTSIDISSGQKIKDIVIAENGKTYDGLVQNGGAGSPNAYCVGSIIHVLYTAYISSTYAEVHCAYDIANETLSYALVQVNGSALNNAWINNHFEFTYGTTSYTSAQANSSICDDGNGTYYIGWVCGTLYRGRAIVFSTTDFIHWTIVYEYKEHIYPIYEMPLVYANDKLFFMIRPETGAANSDQEEVIGTDASFGIVGSVDPTTGILLEKAKVSNCGSRPVFYMYGGIVYLFTNPVDRTNFEILRIDTNDINKSVVYAQGHGAYNYPSFAVDDGNYTIYVLRSDNNMQVSRFSPASFNVDDISEKLYDLFTS